MASSVSEEVRECFKRNPDLITKNLTDLAIWFFVQGQLSYSHLVQGSKSRCAHYRRYLTDEQKKKADTEWGSLSVTDD